MPACGPSEQGTVARKGPVAPQDPWERRSEDSGDDEELEVPVDPAAPSRFLSARHKCCCVVRCGSAGNAIISPETSASFAGASTTPTIGTGVAR
jgi:hypothetical protein